MNWALYEIRSTQNTSSMTILLDVLWPCAVWTVFFPSWHLRQKRAHRDGGGGVWWVAGEDLIGEFPLPEIRNLKERDLQRGSELLLSPFSSKHFLKLLLTMQRKSKTPSLLYRLKKIQASLHFKQQQSPKNFFFTNASVTTPITIFIDNSSPIYVANKLNTKQALNL